MNNFINSIFQPGFFSSGPVHTALFVGGTAAIVSSVVGIFTVIRGQAFAGHSLADVSSAGGSASYLLGINPLLGFLGMAILGAGSMELVGVEKARGRDLATGVVFGAGLGLAALFLYLDVTTTSTSGATVAVLFGSMFAIPSSTVILVVLVGSATLAVMVVLYRPLLLSSLNPEIAAVQGIHVRLVGMLQMLILGSAVALSAISVGAILSTALLIGPAATALRIAKRPGFAVWLAALVGLGTTWIGILLAYDSTGWISGHNWPVSFLIVTLVFLVYLIARPRSGHRGSITSKETSIPLPTSRP
ncbi:MAG: metal ABC transporter permease [Actinomycetota bacterium]|nr:MAG: metal ABC transporter permease [Actinomycetota bacterium]